MKPLKLSENVISITDFKSKASDWLQKLAETEEPVVITQHGQAAAVMLSAKAYDRLMENVRFVTAVESGLHDARVGRSRDHDDVREALMDRFSEP